MKEPDSVPPAQDKDALEAAVAAVLAPVPEKPAATMPQWVDTRRRAVDPKSLY
jgi:hypothetical protein